MNVFVGHISAYEFWRANDLPQTSPSSRVRPRAGSPPRDVERAREYLALRGVGEPVHVVVADANDRRMSKGAVSHVWAGAVSAGAYLELDEGLYMKSPDSSFVEMASELSFVELVRYGYVLCASYAYDEESERGFREREPLTSVRALARAVERESERRGSKKAARALRYIAAVSASPMETVLAMALCLPRMVGGYGLDLPQFAQQLMAQGVTVVTVTTDQFFDARRFDEAARAVAKLTGKRLPTNENGWMTRRHRLRQELLSELRHGRLRGASVKQDFGTCR